MAKTATDTDKSQDSGGPIKSFFSALPFDRLKNEVKDGALARGQHAIDSATDRLTGLADKFAAGEDGGGVAGEAVKKSGEAMAEGGSPAGGALKGGLVGLKDKAKNALTGGGSGGGGGGAKATKSTHIAEAIDVPVPISVAYNTWTEFGEWSGFMKKVENAEQDGDDPTKVNFKAQVFWSHRTWEATIVDMVPDEHIMWRSTGEKGKVDGSVSFHELAPRLTRILVTLEYYPQGLFERTGNIWRAQGRRARLELKHFRRHVMMDTLLDPDEAEGWRGEIHDKEVEREHDEVVEEEEQAEEEAAEDEEPAAEDEEEPAAEEDYEEEPAAEEDYEEEPAAEEAAAEEEPAEDDEDYEELTEDEEPA